MRSLIRALADLVESHPVVAAVIAGVLVIATLWIVWFVRAFEGEGESDGIPHDDWTILDLLRKETKHRAEWGDEHYERVLATLVERYRTHKSARRYKRLVARASREGLRGLDPP